jgi:hypothetical protein
LHVTVTRAAVKRCPGALGGKQKELAPLGFELKVIDREIEALLKAQCIVS